MLALAAVLALLAAACGGGSKTYTAAPTRACLADQERAKISEDVDFVASTASGGAVNVRFPLNQVTVVFAADRDEAANVVRGYERFKGETIGLEDVLRVEHNVVMLWAAHPTDLDLATIHECLE